MGKLMRLSVNFALYLPDYRISGNFDVKFWQILTHNIFDEINFDELQKTLKRRCL